MTRADRQLVTCGIAGSLAVHLVLLSILAASIAFSKAAKPLVEPEPQVTLIYPESIETVPAPPPPLPEAPKKGREPTRYIRTTQNEEAASAPAKADFQSDRNTLASSKAAPDPKGDKPLPTMTGVNQPTMELADRSFKDGEIKEDSAPSSRPSPPQSQSSRPVPQLKPEPMIKPKAHPEKPDPKVKPDPHLKPDPQAKPDQPVKPDQPKDALPKPNPPETKEPLIAKKADTPAEKMLKDAASVLEGLKSTPLPLEPKPEVKMREPVPEMKVPTEEFPVPRAVPVAQPLSQPNPRPAAPLVANKTRNPEKDAFMPQTQRANVHGTITNRGREDAVDAVGTPSGRYMRQVTSAIEKRWHIHRQEKADFVEPGKMRLHFYVNKNGKPEDIRFVFNEANAILTDFTLTSILEAKIPPIPKDLLSMLDKERFEIEYDIVIY